MGDPIRQVTSRSSVMEIPLRAMRALMSVDKIALNDTVGCDRTSSNLKTTCHDSSQKFTFTVSHI